MLNKLFKKKAELTETQKSMLRDLCMFFEKNQELFMTEINSQKDKKEIIKQIYKRLNYSDYPVLEKSQELFKNSATKIYRGISADSNELLNDYINSFIYGEPFYGGRASIYGTGIYTVLGNDINVAKDYASDGGTNNCGIVIESVLFNDSKVIESQQIESIRTVLFEKIRKMYPNQIENYLNILKDDGALSSILGYDAIYVEEKKYIVVLNRKKMIVNSNLLNCFNEKFENYSKR